MAKFIAVTLLAVPVASVAVWIAALYAIGSGSTTPASIVTALSLGAVVAAPVVLGIRWRMHPLVIAFGAVGGHVMWVLAFALAYVVIDALDGDRGGYSVGWARRVR